MCGGIEYLNQKIYFPQSDARLPVRLRHGGVTWITWDKRKNEGFWEISQWWFGTSEFISKWKPWQSRRYCQVNSRSLEFSRILVKEEAISIPLMLTPQLPSILEAKLDSPLSNRLMRYIDPLFSQ